MKEFRTELKKYLFKCINNNFPDIVSPLPIDEKTSSKIDLKERLMDIKTQLVLGFKKNENREIIESLFKRYNIEGFAKTYNLLNDEYSKDLFIKLVAYRILGPSKVKLPLSDKVLWQPMSNIEKKCKKEETHQTKQWTLNLFDLRPIGRDIEYFFTLESVFIAFELNEYGYNKNGVSFKVEKGDYVIDGGACFGDTALMFAEDAGSTGKVFSFEFVEDNLKVFHKNLELNPHLKDRIHLFENALWSNSKENLFIYEDGAGSCATMDKLTQYALKIPSKSIDDLVKEHNISKIDFIKLDIEGAELNCLEGAKQTILKFKPKLAICIYHDLEHFITIPKYIKELVPEYDLYIDHHTACFWETVMYAVPKKEEMLTTTNSKRGGVSIATNLQREEILTTPYPKREEIQTATNSKGERVLTKTNSQKEKILTTTNKPLLTAIIFAYNHETTIELAIKSILQQKTEYSYEIWVCEDCSTDSTLEICKKYAEAYPDKIKLFAQKKNTFTLPLEQNHIYKAFSRIESKYFCYLDGDDYWCDENKIQIALDILEHHPEYSTFAHDTMVVNQFNNKKYSYVHEGCEINIEDTVGFGADAPFLLSSSRIHRNVWDFKKKPIAADYLIFYSILEKGYLYYYDKIMAVYNINDKGTWNSLGKSMIADLNGMFAYKLSLLFNFKQDEFCTEMSRWYDNAHCVGEKHYRKLLLLKKIFGIKLGWKIWFILRFVRKFGFRSMDLNYVYPTKKGNTK